MMDVNFGDLSHHAVPRSRRSVSSPRPRRDVSSIGERRGIADMSGYSATKAAQVGLAESLRAEFTGSQIHVSVVYPVSTETEFRAAMARDYGHSVAGLGPRQQVDDVARAMVACVKRPRPEVYPHRASRALAVVNVIAPGLADRLALRYGRRREVPPASGTRGGETPRK